MRIEWTCKDLGWNNSGPVEWSVLEGFLELADRCAQQRAHKAQLLPGGNGLFGGRRAGERASAGCARGLPLSENLSSFQAQPPLAAADLANSGLLNTRKPPDPGAMFESTRARVANNFMAV